MKIIVCIVLVLAGVPSAVAAEWCSLKGKIVIQFQKPPVKPDITLANGFRIPDEELIVDKNGGLANATLFYSLYLYTVAFRNLRMGYAAALAWVLFLIILAITAVQLVTARLWVYYEGSSPGTVAGPR